MVDIPLSVSQNQRNSSLRLCRMADNKHLMVSMIALLALCDHLIGGNYKGDFVIGLQLKGVIVIKNCNCEYILKPYNYLEFP